MWTVDDILDWPGMSVINMLVYAGMVKSKSEARRMIQQGAVRVDGIKVKSIDAVIAVSPDRQKHAVIDSL